MPNVKVWNLNVPDRTWDGIQVDDRGTTLRKAFPDGVPLIETFKGKRIEIPPGGFIIMEYFEANEFRGQYHAQPLDNDGKLLNDPRHFKMVKIEPLDGPATAATHEAESHVCMQCKHSSPSPEELEAHIKVRHSDSPRLSLPEEDAAIKGRKERGRSQEKAA